MFILCTSTLTAVLVCMQQNILECLRYYSLRINFVAACKTNVREIESNDECSCNVWSMTNVFTKGNKSLWNAKFNNSLKFSRILWTISQGRKESIVVRTYFEFDDLKRALKLQLYDQQIFSFFSNKNLNGIKQKYIDSGKEWIYW